MGASLGNALGYNRETLSMSVQDTTAKRVVADLVMAILAVNGWTIDRVYSLREGLKAETLLSLKDLSRSSIQEIANKLNVAGYTRGEYMCALLAHRLKALTISFDSQFERELLNALKARRIEDVEKFLVAIHGVGPSVVRSFKVLAGL